ncbi:hypothetical protein GW17_00030423 [Ensete ventricosum]|nr:hypothetical protein GW17_00030423 [Ensete ventricosum]RZS07578.1 hypothetical protein BHM03_00038438 [Ensete ventricosum]
MESVRGESAETKRCEDTAISMASILFSRSTGRTKGQKLRAWASSIAWARRWPYGYPILKFGDKYCEHKTIYNYLFDILLCRNHRFQHLGACSGGNEDDRPSMAKAPTTNLPNPSSLIVLPPRPSSSPSRVPMADEDVSGSDTDGSSITSSSDGDHEYPMELRPMTEVVPSSLR